ncbi:rhodopsin, GQ-coupled-like [Actinia tenebrosa]|uniref:Rhodopsin, GQ-coupled-like n=1 Tax=Actinia tenebrosa TaxID=6105 RepID=A0A6P8HZ88_ACTTE|nr:rhodopsin, GQ-coupled-like [Actinia tenebrosa]
MMNVAGNGSVFETRVIYSEIESAFQATSLIIIMGVAILTNIFNITVVYLNYSMQTPRYMFIINLAGGDLGVALLSMPFCLVTSIARDWVFGSAFCQLHGFLGSLFFCVSIFTLTIMSIEQYHALVKPLSRAINIRRAWYMIALVWSLSVLVSIQPIFGWGHFSFNSSTLACGVSFPKRVTERLYLLLLVLLAFVTPLLIMGYAYIRIFIAVQKHSIRIAQYTKGGQEVIRLQRRITFTLLLVLIVFLLCWMPFVILIVLASSRQDVLQLPWGLGVAAYWCGFFNSALNPIIFVIRNDKFREGYIEILSCLWGCIRCRDIIVLKKGRRRSWQLSRSMKRARPSIVLGSVKRFAPPQELVNEEGDS